MLRTSVLTMVILTGALLAVERQAVTTSSVTIRLVDAETGQQLPGLIQITGAGGERFEPAELLARGQGLGAKLPIQNWFVLAQPTEVSLPHERLTIAAFSGLDTEVTTVPIDPGELDESELTIPLRRFAAPRKTGWVSANTHLHLQKLTREQSDRYLREIPKADGLDVVFLSYLERAEADRDYISNKYTRDDLELLSESTGVLFGNGEEHRHNFAGFGEGYGHVMLLNIEKLIVPVSIGPGIMKTGHDGIPLKRGINTASGDGATVIWCHNAWGMEAIPNWVTGTVDAQNIFDGGEHGSFKDSFYRLLNIGVPVAFSTGTDWFMYDFSRTYVKMRPGPVTVERWLDQLRRGQSMITNGPLLSLEVAGRDPGGEIAMREPGEITVVARARGRLDFDRMELIQNGKVIRSVESRPIYGHFEAQQRWQLKVTEPCWLALRTPPPATKDDPQLQQPTRRNEFGRELFAHTGAVFVDVTGERIFQAEVAREMIAEMRTSMEQIAKRGKFQDDQDRARVLDVYQDGIAAMQWRIERSERKPLVDP